jgi:hypothetical protein
MDRPTIEEDSNVILIGSSISNEYTRDKLNECDAFYRFHSDPQDKEHDHAIVQERQICYDAEKTRRADGREVFTCDYALIAAFQRRAQSIVVLAGCRAYGQLLLGDFLTNPAMVSALCDHVFSMDYQCILKANIQGRNYKYGGVVKLMVRHEPDGKWGQMGIDEGSMLTATESVGDSAIRQSHR